MKNKQTINEDKSPIDFIHYNIEYLNGELMYLLGEDRALSLEEFIDAIENVANKFGIEHEPEVIAGWFAGLIMDEDTFEAICDEETVGKVKKCVEKIKKGTFDKYIQIYMKSPKKLYDILRPRMNEGKKIIASRRNDVNESNNISYFPTFAQFVNTEI